jgi:hypothetical protein
LETLGKIRAQLEDKPFKIAQICALSQLSNCLNSIDWSDINKDQLDSLKNDRNYIYAIKTHNPYIILLHLKLLTRLNTSESISNDNQYFIEEYCILKNVSNHIGKEYGIVGLLLQAMTNNLLVNSLLNSQPDPKDSLPSVTDVTTELLTITRNELQEIINRTDEISLIDELMITGEISYNASSMKEAIQSLLKDVDKNQNGCSSHL